MSSNTNTGTKSTFNIVSKGTSFTTQGNSNYCTTHGYYKTQFKQNGKWSNVLYKSLKVHAGRSSL